MTNTLAVVLGSTGILYGVLLEYRARFRRKPYTWLGVSLCLMGVVTLATQAINSSTVQRLNSSTVQQLNGTVVEQINNSTALQFKDLTVKRLIGKEVQPFTSTGVDSLVTRKVSVIDTPNYVMSRNKSVFHKPNCRYAQMLKQENLRAFEFDWELPEGAQPCKYCCKDVLETCAAVIR